MLKHRHIVRASARRIAKAANQAVQGYQRDEVEEETDFTALMLGHMKESMNDYEVRGVRWSAKILTSHRPNAQETRFGADFVGVVKMDLPDFGVAKGFLAQAKRVEPGDSFRQSEWDRLVDQSRAMLTVSLNHSYFSTRGMASQSRQQRRSLLPASGATRTECTLRALPASTNSTSSASWVIPTSSPPTLPPSNGFKPNTGFNSLCSPPIHPKNNLESNLHSMSPRSRSDSLPFNRRWHTAKAV